MNDQAMTGKQINFRRDLEDLINRHSMEAGSLTADYILAEYLGNCLDAFDTAVTAREKHEGRAP